MPDLQGERAGAGKKEAAGSRPNGTLGAAAAGSSADDELAAPSEEFVLRAQRPPKVEAAFSAAAAASAATAAAVDHSPATLQTIAATLVRGPTAADRLAAAHRLNEAFTTCGSYEQAERLAAELCSEALCKALVDVLVEGDALVEVATLLMQSLAVHADGARALTSAGLLPVLVAALRADEPLFRAQGLSLLAALVERPELVQPSIKAGVGRLLSFLARGCEAADRWASIVEILNAVLASPLALPPPQRKQLLKAMGPAADRASSGELALEASTARGLARAVGTLRAHELAAVRPPAAATASASPAQPQPGAGFVRMCGTSAHTRPSVGSPSAMNGAAMTSPSHLSGVKYFGA